MERITLLFTTLVGTLMQAVALLSASAILAKSMGYAPNLGTLVLSSNQLASMVIGGSALLFLARRLRGRLRRNAVPT